MSLLVKALVCLVGSIRSTPAEMYAKSSPFPSYSFYIYDKTCLQSLSPLLLDDILTLLHFLQHCLAFQYIGIITKLHKYKAKLDMTNPIKSHPKLYLYSYDSTKEVKQKLSTLNRYIVTSLRYSKTI